VTAALRVGFGQTDITPPLGTHKIGWLRDIVADRVLDPLSARAVAIESHGAKVAVIQLDTLSIRWTQVAEIRRRTGERFGFPGEAVMVAATHNHAGPAVANAGDVRRDEAYVETLIAKAVQALGHAIASMAEAEIAFGRCCEFRVAHNRRVTMRDGTVRTHGSFDDADALCLEGPIDPEVAVLAARMPGGQLLGAIVNFACHPAHHGGETAFSAGYPGVLANEMRARGCPATLFLNGACGNIADADPCSGGAGMSKEQIGRLLAEDVARVLSGMTYEREMRLGARSRTVQLPFRAVTDDEARGTSKGAQRFIDSAIYDRDIPRQLQRIRRMGVQPAEVQAIFINERTYVALPGECFVELGLRVKEKSRPRRAVVVGYANGMVGYVPHRDAFLRGGYETTFAGWSRLAPEAGDILADCAVELIRQGP